MGHGYISDTEARLLGLHRLGAITVHRDPGAPDCYKRKSTFDHAHLAGVLRKTLEASPGTITVNVNRMVLAHFMALCEAIVRVQAADSHPGTGGAGNKETI